MILQAVLFLAMFQPSGEFDAGMRAYRSGDLEAARRVWLGLAQKGVADAQYALADLYRSCRLKKCEYEEAKKWYEEAGENGRTDAFLALAQMVFSRQLPYTDYEGVAYLRMGAEEGNAQCQYLLATRLAGQQRLIPIYKWFALAARSGYQAAAKERDLWAKRMTPDQLKDATELVTKWRPRKGMPWYQSAAEDGDPVGIVKLAGVFEQKGDSASAARWTRIAAAQGYAPAQANLGTYYAEGLGVPQNYGEARKWWLAAAEQEHSYAQSMLGRMYYVGEGVPKDYVESHMWFILSAAQGDDGGRQGLETTAKAMSAAQVSEAKRRAVEWKARIAARKAPGKK